VPPIPVVNITSSDFKANLFPFYARLRSSTYERCGRSHQESRVFRQDEQRRRFGRCVAGVQPRLLRSFEARTGQLSQRIHSQGSEDRGSVGGAIRRDPGNSEFAAGAARDRAGGDFLGM
jgi:hypothetical protein